MRMFEFALNVTIAGAGASLFILSKPLARGLSEWSAKQYKRFPRLKLLPGSGRKGVELQNYFHLVSDLWSVRLSHNSPLRSRFVAFSTPINLVSNCNN